MKILGKINQASLGLLVPLLLSLSSPGYAGDAASPVTARHREPQFVTGQPGNVFLAETGTCPIEFADRTDIATGKVTVTDEANKVLEVVAVSPGTNHLDIRLPGKGYYALEAAVQYRDGATATARSTAAVIGSPIAETSRRASRFGLMTVHGSHALAAAAGARWDWSFMRLEQFTLSADGQTVTSTQEIGRPGNSPLTRIVALNGWLPAWLNPPGATKALYPPRDWALFEKLATALAQRSDIPEYFAVYNEPDAYWRGTDDELVRFHAVVAKAIKSAHPTTKVLGPCSYHISIADLNKLVKCGLLDSLDGLVMHAYVNGTMPEAEFIQRVIDLRAYLASVGKKDFPIYLTEFGWTTSTGTWQKPVDEITQACYVTRSLTLLSAVDVAASVYFCFSYHTTNAGEAGFSLLNPQNTPKPGFAAYATVTRWLTDVRTPGSWLRITPTTNLALFRKGDAAVGVAWDTRGPSALTLPMKARAMEDYLGRAVTTGTENSLPLGQGPVFFALANADLCGLKDRPVCAVMCGGRVSLPWTPAIVPQPLQVHENEIVVPDNAPLGQYRILGKTPDGWEWLPLQVRKPLTIESVAVSWPTQQPAPALTVSVQSAVGKEWPIQAALALNGRHDPLVQEAILKTSGPTLVAIPLDTLSTGERYQGSLTVEGKGGRWRETRPVDFTILACPPVSDPDLPADWAAVPALDFSKFAPFLGSATVPPFPATDCQATLRVAHSATGLCLQIVVTDDQHTQTGPAVEMWKQDCVQISMDVDAGQPWQPNNLGFGFNGHRIFEYGVALGKQGPMVWRWVAFDPTLAANTGEPRVKADVTREGTTTRYQLLFPWATLGLAAPPAPGTRLGFSLAVNDVDGTGPRHGLRLFGGIVENKDPTQFGVLWIR